MAEKAAATTAVTLPEFKLVPLALSRALSPHATLKAPELLHSVDVIIPMEEKRAKTFVSTSHVVN